MLHHHLGDHGIKILIFYIILVYIEQKRKISKLNKIISGVVKTLLFYLFFIYLKKIINNIRN
jgi:hypothetical protein